MYILIYYTLINKLLKQKKKKTNKQTKKKTNKKNKTKKKQTKKTTNKLYLVYLEQGRFTSTLTPPNYESTDSCNQI